MFTFLKAQKHAKDLWGWLLNAFDFEFEEFFGILMRMLRHAPIRCGLAFSLLSRWLSVTLGTRRFPRSSDMRAKQAAAQKLILELI